MANHKVVGKINYILHLYLTGKKAMKTSDKLSTSTATSISTDSVLQFIELIKGQRTRETTRRNYHTIWRSFNRFLLKLDRVLDSWEDKLTLFVGYLVDKNRKSTTIRSYVSVIKSILMIEKIDINEDRYLITSLTKACRYRNDRVITRPPIHKSML